MLFIFVFFIFTVPAQIEEISGPTEVVADLGSTVEFGCRASGYPFPTVKWRREDSILSVDGRRLRQTFEFLQISNVQETDSGAYVCEASNGFGEPQTRRYRLTVFGECFKIAEQGSPIPRLSMKSYTQLFFVSSSGETVNYWVTPLVSNDAKDDWESPNPAIGIINLTQSPGTYTEKLLLGFWIGVIYL